MKSFTITSRNAAFTVMLFVHLTMVTGTGNTALAADEPYPPSAPDAPLESRPHVDEAMPPSGDALEKKTWPELVDSLHVDISRRVFSTASWLDSFFGDERSLLEENRSYLRARYDIFGEEQAKTLFKPAMDLRLVLPQLEKKAHIVISAEPVETPGTAGTQARIRGERIAATDERNVTTALSYFIRTATRENILVRTGAQIIDWKPVWFINPRYRSLTPLGIWDLRFTQDVIYRTDTEWQTDTRFDLERNLPYDLFFRTTIGGIWYANTHGYFYALAFSVRQAIDATNALDYEWINNYQTRPSYELTEIAFRIRYRQSFLREWLFFEVAPQVRFPRDRDFMDIPGILFRIEMFFGRNA